MVFHCKKIISEKTDDFLFSRDFFMINKTRLNGNNFEFFLKKQIILIKYKKAG